jgi:hypothetical protein
MKLPKQYGMKRETAKINGKRIRLETDVRLATEREYGKSTSTENLTAGTGRPSHRSLATAISYISVWFDTYVRSFRRSARCIADLKPK